MCDRCVQEITNVCSVHVCVDVCDPADTFSLCAEEKGATPRSRCSSTNLVVTVPFIPPIGHGALWQSHVFAHWERQFLANFNRTVAHKKGRATCTGGGAKPAHLCTRLLTCLVCGCVPLDWLMLSLVVVESCWMLNVTDLPLVPNVLRSFWCDMNVGCILANAVWLAESGKSSFSVHYLLMYWVHVCLVVI